MNNWRRRIRGSINQIGKPFKAERRVHLFDDISLGKVGQEREQELLKKIPQIKKGESVRPPLEWWKKMLREVEQNYPSYSKERQQRIVAGIWHGYNKEQQIGIVRDIIREGGK